MLDRFRGSDGTMIAVRVERGPARAPALLFVNGLACPGFYWDRMREAFRGQATLVSFDLKGHGDSGAARSARGATIEGCAEDAALALDEAGCEHAIVFGFSMGCQIALEMSRAHRHRVAGYVLALGAFERPFETLLEGRLGALPRRIVDATPAGLVGLSFKLGRAAMKLPGSHGLAQRASMVGHKTPARAMLPFYEHMAAIHAPTWIGLARSAAQHSAADLLPTIRVPTLVVTGGRDTLTPPRVGRAMAASIFGAEYLELPRATHTGLLDESLAIVGASARFLQRAGIFRG